MAAATGHAKSLWCEAPGRYGLRDVELPVQGADQVLVRALHSCVSRGTERLVFKGRVPASEAERMRCPFMDGDFSFPVKYGYALVGVVDDGPPEIAGQPCFLLHPHQTRMVVPKDALRLLPTALPPRRATLAANMETALNVAWDCGASMGDRVLILGAGVVGLLLARLVAQIPGAEVVVCDQDPGKRAAAEAMGAVFCEPGALTPPFDVAVNATGVGTALQTAIDVMGREGRIVEASWHGTAQSVLELGGAFHSQRLSLVSSQVSVIPPVRAPRWDYGRRFAAVTRLLDDPALDALFTHTVAFDDAPTALPPLMDDGEGAIAISIDYCGA